MTRRLNRILAEYSAATARESLKELLRQGGLAHFVQVIVQCEWRPTMPERLTSTSKARAKLRRLSQTAQKSLDRYIITVRGEPQSVLIGYDEYQSMKAAVELMQRPEVVEDIKAGLKELDEGKGVPLTEMKARVREAGRLKETNKLAQELAAESGVDSRIVEIVMVHLGEK